MASGRVIVDSRFGAYEKDVERAVGKALKSAANTGVRAAKGTSHKGYDVGGIIGTVKVTSPRRGPKGIELDIVWNDFRAIFFEKGTYRRRRAKLAQARKSSSGQRGVKALRFMAAAKKGAQDAAIDALRREMPKR